MISYFKTVDKSIEEIDAREDGCWINVVSPTENEISYLEDELMIDAGFIRSSLDEEETSHIEPEDNQTLVIIDIPVATVQTDKTISYSTTPFGIIVTAKNVITISLKENPILNEFESGMVRNVQTHLKTRFVFMVLLRVASRYLQYLKQIDKASLFIEKQLHKSMKNKELFSLLDLEKSLVYFNTSLKADTITIEKLLKGRILKLYEEDEDLLEDVLIEFRQAIEMANIHSDVLSVKMDAVASVISNNLNIVMRVLTSLTIVMAIPTIVTGFYGMNIQNLPLSKFWWMPILISVVLMAVMGLILRFKKML